LLKFIFDYTFFSASAAMEQVIKNVRLYNELMKNLGNVEEIVKIVLVYLEKALFDNKDKEGKEGLPRFHSCNFYNSWNEFISIKYTIDHIRTPEVYWETNGDYVIFNMFRTPANQVIKGDIVYLYSFINNFRHAIKVEKEDHNKIVKYLQRVNAFTYQLDLK
jgi:hypothetical protein